jgi:hypothetical protein
VKDLLSSYSLCDKLITYVKDEGDNLSTLTWAISSVVSCAVLGLTTPWQGSCFGHAFNKACQYAYNDANVCFSFRKVNLRPHNLPYNIQLCGLKNPVRNAMNGSGLALIWGSTIENWKLQSRPGLLARLFSSKKP